MLARSQFLLQPLQVKPAICGAPKMKVRTGKDAHSPNHLGSGYFREPDDGPATGAETGILERMLPEPVVAPALGIPVPPPPPLHRGPYEPPETGSGGGGAYPR